MKQQSKTIVVLKKNVYGKELIYPVNDMATIFTQLMKRKTFDLADLKLIKELGYEIEVEAQKLEV